MSIYLAQLLGPAMVLAAIGLALNPSFYRNIANELNANHVLIVFAGMASMIAGTAILLAHNIWAADWRLIITLLGWLMIIGGTVRLVAPSLVLKLGADVVSSRLLISMAGLFYGLIGLTLCAFGYVL